MTLIEQLLAEYPPDQRHLRVDFDCSDEGYVARAVLTLPTLTLTVQTIRDDEAAIDDLLERLATAMKGQLS
jgi:hypothetical protein